MLSVSAGERIRIAHTTLEAMGSAAMADLFRFFEEGTHGELPDQDLFKLLEHDRFEAAVDDLADKVAGMSDGDRGTYRSELFDFLAGAERLTLLERSGIEQLILHCDQEAPASTYRADFLRLRHAAAFSRPAPALVIETAVAETLIESSEIRGTLSLYGPPAEPPLDRGNAARLLNANPSKLGIRSTHRSVHVTGNRLAQIAVDQEIVAQLLRFRDGAEEVLADVFRQAFLSNNTIESDGNALIAAGHHLSDLRFQNRDQTTSSATWSEPTRRTRGFPAIGREPEGFPVLINVTRASAHAVLVAVRLESAIIIL